MDKFDSTMPFNKHLSIKLRGKLTSKGGPLALWGGGATFWAVVRDPGKYSNTNPAGVQGSKNQHKIVPRTPAEAGALVFLWGFRCFRPTVAKTTW